MGSGSSRSRHLRDFEGVLEDLETQGGDSLSSPQPPPQRRQKRPPSETIACLTRAGVPTLSWATPPPPSPSPPPTTATAATEAAAAAEVAADGGGGRSPAPPVRPAGRPPPPRRTSSISMSALRRPSTGPSQALRRCSWAPLCVDEGDAPPLEVCSSSVGSSSAPTRSAVRSGSSARGSIMKRASICDAALATEAGRRASTASGACGVGEARRRRASFLATWAAGHPGGQAAARRFGASCGLGCVAACVSQLLTVHSVAEAAVTLEEVSEVRLPGTLCTTAAEVCDVLVAYLRRGAKAAGGAYEVTFAACDAGGGGAGCDSDEEDREEGSGYTTGRGGSAEVCVAERPLSLLALQKELSGPFLLDAACYCVAYDPAVERVADASFAPSSAAADGSSPPLAGNAAEDEDEDEDEEGREGGALAASLRPRRSVPTRERRSRTAHAVILGYTASVEEVLLGVVARTAGGGVVVSVEAVSLPKLFDACVRPDDYTGLPRGLTKVTLLRRPTRPVSAPAPLSRSPSLPRCDDEAAQGPKLFWTDEELAGGGGGVLPSPSKARRRTASLLGGIDPVASPPLVAAAYAVHLCNASAPCERDAGVSIPTGGDCGVPLSDLRSTLRLPLDDVVRPCPANVSALYTACFYLQSYLQAKGATEVVTGLQPVLRREGAPDGAPGHTLAEFSKVLKMVAASQGRCVVVACFDACCARQHLRRATHGVRAHFGAVAGYDGRTVHMADVAPSVYRSVWEASVERLWTAMDGFGYLLVAPRRVVEVQWSGSTLQAMGRRADALLELGRFKLPPQCRVAAASADAPWFAFPQRVFCVTLAALALTETGRCRVTPEEVVGHAGIPLTACLSDSWQLSDFAGVLTHYSHNALGRAAAVEVLYTDTSLLTEKTFAAALASGDGESVVVHYSPSELQAQDAWWNGHSGGAYAVAQRVDEDGLVVCFRAWARAHNPVSTHALADTAYCRARSVSTRVYYSGASIVHAMLQHRPGMQPQQRTREVEMDPLTCMCPRLSLPSPPPFHSTSFHPLPPAPCYTLPGGDQVNVPHEDSEETLLEKLDCASFPLALTYALSPLLSPCILPSLPFLPFTQLSTPAQTLQNASNSLIRTMGPVSSYGEG